MCMCVCVCVFVRLLSRPSGIRLHCSTMINTTAPSGDTIFIGIFRCTTVCLCTHVNFQCVLITQSYSWQSWAAWHCQMLCFSGQLGLTTLITLRGNLCHTHTHVCVIECTVRRVEWWHSCRQISSDTKGLMAEGRLHQEPLSIRTTAACWGQIKPKSHHRVKGQRWKVTVPQWGWMNYRSRFVSLRVNVTMHCSSHQFSSQYSVCAPMMSSLNGL